MNVQLFQSKNAWTDKSSLISFTDIFNFQKGESSNLLQRVNYSEFENYVIYQAKSTLQNEEYNDFTKKKHLLLPFLKNRKKIIDYINEGVWKLSKDLLTEDNFVTIKNVDMQTLSRSIDKGLYGLIKTMLPCYTSCYFGSGGKGKNNVIGHSGFLPLDIDNKITPENVQELKKLGVYAITPSTGGEVRPIFRIDLSDKLIKKVGGLSNLHELYFDFFNEKLKSIGIQIDVACRNINRLFYISSNCEFEYFYIDDEAPEITLPKDIEKLKSTREVKKNEYKTYVDGLSESVNISDSEKQEIILVIKKELKETFDLCQNNNIQPFYYEGSMYPNLRDFHYSLKDYLTEEELTHWLSKFLTLSKLDKRLEGTEYINRGITYIKNEIIK